MGVKPVKMVVLVVTMVGLAWLAVKASHAVRTATREEDKSRRLACRQLSKGGMCDTPYFGVDQDDVHTLCTKFDKTCYGSKVEVVVDHAAKLLAQDLRQALGQWVGLGLGSGVVAVLLAVAACLWSGVGTWKRRKKASALGPGNASWAHQRLLASEEPKEV